MCGYVHLRKQGGSINFICVSLSHLLMMGPFVGYQLSLWPQEQMNSVTGRHLGYGEFHFDQKQAGKHFQTLLQLFTFPTSFCLAQGLRRRVRKPIIWSLPKLGKSQTGPALDFFLVFVPHLHLLPKLLLASNRPSFSTMIQSNSLSHCLLICLAQLASYRRVWLLSAHVL